MQPHSLNPELCPCEHCTKDTGQPEGILSRFAPFPVSVPTSSPRFTRPHPKANDLPRKPLLWIQDNPAPDSQRPLHLGNHTHPLRAKPGRPGHLPVHASMELRQPLVPGLGVQSVHVLSHQPVQLPEFLPAAQSPVCWVGLVRGELGPAHKVSGPVPLADWGTAYEIHVLDGSPVGAGVQSNLLRPVVWDPRLRGDSCACHHEKFLGKGNEAL